MVQHFRAPRFGGALLVVLTGGCTVVTSASEPAAGKLGDAVDGLGGGSSSGDFGSGDASACQPGNVATYHADTYHAASGAGQGACLPDYNGDPITAFYSKCLDGSSADPEQCSVFRSQYAGCVACILTPETAAKYGPLIDHGAFVTANIAGCIELASDQQPDASELTCAGAVQALAGCELAACEANCAVHDNASLAAYDACASAAEAGGCGPYTSAASCAQAEQDASPLFAACLGRDFGSFYQIVAPYFCGPPIPAGADASSAAPVLDAPSD